MAHATCVLLFGLWLASGFSAGGASLAPTSEGAQTELTKALNHQIAKGKNGTFTGGKGVLVRTPDKFDNSDMHVRPATFWVNDIVAVSQLYPTGNPWCPNNGSDGYEQITWMNCSDHPQSNTTGPWNYATVGVVVGSSMQLFMPDFEHIQNVSWGYGVFYGTSSNSVDQRCYWSKEYKGWDCPGGWMGFDGKFYPNSTKKGAGNFDPGNPKAGLGGGGAGCHFNSGLNRQDQSDAIDKANVNLVGDYDCECNYAFNADWDKWVQHWLDNNQERPGFENRAWFGKGKSPSWGVDVAMCWMNNPRDMINLQNAMYKRRHDWNNQLAPMSNWTSGRIDDIRRYWGWNEVPVNASAIASASSWDAVIVKLPANVCAAANGTLDNPTCLDADAQKQLESDLHFFVAKKYVKTGIANIDTKPGSSIVFVREIEADADQWEREFFCSNWTSPSNKFRIVHNASAGNNTGSCYLDTANGTETVLI